MRTPFNLQIIVANHIDVNGSSEPIQVIDTGIVSADGELNDDVLTMCHTAMENNQNHAVGIWNPMINRFQYWIERS